MPSLRDFVLQRVDRKQAPRLRMSQAGSSCVREVYYAATGAPSAPTKHEGLVKMAIGSGFDALALQSHGSVACQVDVRIVMGGVEVWGHADAVFHDEHGDPLHVADLKTVGLSTWEKIQKAPKQEHVAQVNLYAYGLGAPTWSVLYVNASTGEMLEHFGELDEFAARKTFGQFEEAFYWMQKGKAPPRPYEDIEEDDGTVKLAREAFPCRFCPYLSTCWRAEDTDECKQPVSAA